MARRIGLFIALLLATTAAATPCTQPTKRRAWHTLSNSDKLAYINAELCLMHKPATLKFPGAKTKYDEFQYVHQVQAYATHFVGAFLPFHRLMLYHHETVLRQDCNYTGYQPYWYEQLDAGNFSKASIFDATYGFGGDGAGTGPSACITNGPFANYTNSLGPAYEITTHCLNRRFNEQASIWVSQADVDTCLAKPDFETAWPCIETNPHNGGHAGVGGQMEDGASSPGDPLFYLHHTWLDKVFWDWQARDRAKRTRYIGGTNVGPEFVPLFPPRPSSIPRPTGADGDPGLTTTLTHVLNMYGLAPNKTIADVLDIQGDYLCYEYVEP